MYPHLAKVKGQTVLIANLVNFKEKLARFVADGPSKLNVVSDFDYTMTKFNISGHRGFSCHRVLEECGALGNDYHERATALQRKYYAIEVNPKIGHDEKVGHMVDWVTQAHDLLLEAKLTRAVLKNAVAKARGDNNIALRNEVIQFMDTLAQQNVPMLVFSAGIADILEEVLLEEMGVAALPSNVHVVSNRCKFRAANGDSNSSTAAAVGDDELLVGFEEPVFHVLNKRASEVINCDNNAAYFQRGDLQGRTNLLLLGDSLGDCLMHQGLHHEADRMIRIGFLNDKPERLPDYLNSAHFDMVILGDPNFDFPMEVLNSILQNQVSTVLSGLGDASA